MKNYKILVVDDEVDILDLLEYNLKKENFIVKTAQDGKEALAVAKDFLPDLIILDVMMPEIDGIETCRLLRENTTYDNTIIVFLTARGEDYSEIAGFNVGANDYVTKPLRIRTLIARLNALLKHKKTNKEKSFKKETVFGDITINFEQRHIKINDKKILLPKKEFQILALLLSNPEKVFTRNEIYHAIWGSEVIVGDRTLDVHVRKLRKKIGNKYIRTFKGIGYAINLND